MKSSNNSKKTNIDDISRETQRLISDSHVRLPYHKPKQKSLKDFLNRQKISTQYQPSLTGSKKLLHKAWELIESKEQTVEKFYNEDSVQEENNDKASLNNSNSQAENHFSLNDNNFDKECTLNENHNNSLSEFNDDEENYDDNSVVASELSSDDEAINNSEDESIDDNKAIGDDKNEANDDDENEGTDDDDDDDDENNFRQGKNLCSEEPFIEDDKSEEDSEDELKKNIVKTFIDDEAELSELDCSSGDEDNFPSFINESGDEEDRDIEFPKKKKHRAILLSESSDDEMNCTNENDSNTEINLISNNSSPLFNESEPIVSTQQLLGLCSGQFQSQSQQLDAKEDNEEVDDFEDNFDSEVPINDADITNEDDADDDDVSLKLVSAKDYFDDEAELSESDWSSDDEDKLVGLNDKLEEEEGDKDKLDESLVKDGLDKIYMRQLLDDDNQQVTALKEMLLEDGELYSDSNRKRKFQWDDADQDDAAFKKPLFSDNEDDNEDDVLSDDEKTEQWRKERFKRESYLSEKNKYSDEESNEDEESSNILQTSVSVVKKTHVVKYLNGKNRLISKTFDDEKSNESTQLNEHDETDPNSQNLSTNSTITIETNKIKTNDFVDPQVVNIISSKHNKCIKGSFMKRNGDKLTNTLLFVNKKITNNDGTNPKKYEEKNDIKSLNTITATATSNPFAYLMRNDKKYENDGDLMKIEKTDTTINLNKTCISVKTTSYLRSEENQQTVKLNKSSHSILKQFD
ncbi:claspin-like [Melanaphis sacchari]|nr:claspin-like [Melanaphis sacchari]